MENNLNNLPPFYVGQKVVAISDGSESGRKKGKIYVVKGIMKRDCGCMSIDVGFKATLPYNGCGTHEWSYFESTIFWQSPAQYRPSQQMKFPLITYSKVLEKELVTAN